MLTHTRLQGLRHLAKHEEMRRSNVTDAGAKPMPVLYWQTGDWLVSQGYATAHTGFHGSPIGWVESYRITGPGRAKLEKAGG